MNNVVSKPFSFRWWGLRSEINKMLAASIAFSVLLIIARVIYTREWVFVFLLWNLFLAVIPYLLTSWLQLHPRWIEHKVRLTAVFIVWLLFIPNTFYILTDLFHLGNYYKVPLWFDLVLIVSFAWNGLVLGILSVRQMEKVMVLYLWRNTTGLFLYPVMILNALGVYAGRYLRLNSWDVFTNPLGVITDITNLLLHPLQYKYACGMIVCFSILMTLIYQTIKGVGKVIG